ncbi:MAG: glycoside hydrolase family 127 protein [Lachnospiraceae bacterium]|nr:glycoside hydrolase family 127 protein [Lachnospiraceae bacterium]
MGKQLKQLDLKNIQITDELFGEYVNKVSQKIIPHQWKILNDLLENADPTYCIWNFKVAAGIIKGDRKGVVFQDTDLYKWLESVAYCLSTGQGKEFEALADEVIDVIGMAQEPDGYLNTYYTVNAPSKKWSNLVEGHELYTSGHLIEAAVAYYQATQKDKFLDIAIKNANLICNIFGDKENQIHGYPGHQEIEIALIKLYRLTGMKQYLDTAYYFIRQRGKAPNYFEEEIRQRGGYEFFPEFNHYDLAYSQAHEEPIKQTLAEGHAVRAMYMCAAMADLAAEYGDKELGNACQLIWENTVTKRMYITGGIGSSGFRERFTTDYDLPNRTNYAETCASIGLMMFGQRMASLTGKASYYDVVEKALYNTVLAGINIDGDRYFYVNPLEVVPEFCTEHTYMEHVKPIRQKWFSVACCPPNVARTLASLGQYIYAQDDEALYIHQFISSSVLADICGKHIKIAMQSQLLRNGQVELKANADHKVLIKVRKPEYANEMLIKMDGKTIIPHIEDGYLMLDIENGEHIISIDFEVSPRWCASHRNVRENSGKIALTKGPVVYCLEEIDNGKYLSEIYVSQINEVYETETMKGLVGNLPSLEFDADRIRNIAKITNGLYGEINTEIEPVRTKAVPYCMWNNRGMGEMSVWQKLRV